MEAREVALEGEEVVTNPERAAAACDENTIGVVSVLGSTFTGHYEDVQATGRALDALEAKTGLDIPIHVDGASGGFVAPFLQPELVWDFRLPRVKSINTSGHKYGLVYPGVGWIVWRELADLDEDLIFKVDYLGGSMPTLAINFSRPASQIVAQYYNLIRLGRSGYRAVHEACREVAIELAGQIAGARAVRNALDRAGSARAGVEAERAGELDAVRSFRPPARPRLAGAGLSHARQSRRNCPAAHCGPQRLHARPGRHVVARHEAAPGMVRLAARLYPDECRRGFSPLRCGKRRQLITDNCLYPRHSATPPKMPSSFETMETFFGSLKVIFLVLPPPR